jgi:hypothetical protein
LLYFPAATHTFALAEHRHALASDLLRWLSGFRDNSEAETDMNLDANRGLPELPSTKRLTAESVVGAA